MSNNYPEKEMASMLAEFTPQMWNEVRCVADALEFFAFGLSGQSDWRELPPLPRSIIREIVDKLDVMMTRLLKTHQREDLIPQWQSVREAILPPLPPASLPPAEHEQRRPRERLCGNRAPARKSINRR